MWNGNPTSVNMTTSISTTKLRKNPERLAWVILLSAFAIFCLLAVGVPWVIHRYLTTATCSHKATLDVIEGTILMEEPGTRVPIGVTGTIEVPEGAVLSTDSSSRAILTFFEESTVLLYRDTRIRLVEARSPRFRFSQRPNRIVLEVKGGWVRIGVALPIHTPLHFEVRTPQARFLLEEGSYSVEVSNEFAQIVVRDGIALVSAADRVIALRRGERTRVKMNEPPQRPMPAPQNLVTNGNFNEPLSVGWTVERGQSLPEDALPGNVELVTAGGRRAVYFHRMGKDGEHTEVGITQRIDKEVRDYISLKVRLDVRLLYQSLSGGGLLSSEFPIIVRLDYIDVYGNPQFWTHGFYYQNRDGFPIINGEQIPQGVWYPYESENLFMKLKEAPPAHLTSIRIYASGWNYQCMVSNVGVIVE